MGGKKPQTTATRGERNSGKYISEKTEKELCAQVWRNVRDVRSFRRRSREETTIYNRLDLTKSRMHALLNAHVSWIKLK